MFGRPSRHMIPGGKTEFTEMSAVAAQFTQKCREGLKVSAGVYEARMDRSDQVPCCAHMVAGDDGAAAAGRFVHHHRKRFIFRWQHHKICGGVYGGQGRMIHESAKGDAPADSRSVPVPLQFRKLCSFAALTHER